MVEIPEEEAGIPEAGGGPGPVPRAGGLGGQGVRQMDQPPFPLKIYYVYIYLTQLHNNKKKLSKSVITIYIYIKVEVIKCNERNMSEIKRSMKNPEFYSTPVDS